MAVAVGEAVSAARPASSRCSPPRITRPRWIAALAAASGALAVGYLASLNPRALPAGVAVSSRVVVILVLAAAGLYASLEPARRAMGTWLLAASLFACGWLLNGSAAAFPYTVGVVLSGLGPTVICWLLLVHPTGRIRSDKARTFVLAAGGVLMGAWELLALTSSTPPLATPLLRCAPHCPTNLAYLGVDTGVGPALRALVLACAVLLPLGTLLILSRRFKRASEPARRMLAPVEVVAAALTLLVAGWLITRAQWETLASSIGTAYLAAFAAVPAAIFTGLYLERSYLKGALARLLERLPRARPENVESLLAESVKDPSLKLAYRTHSGWIDFGGRPIDIERAAQRQAVAVINCAGLPAAAVLFDLELGDQGHFITAAGEAALMALDRNELQQRLDIDARELATARRQALEAAVFERRRIMRDLHDGAQQRLLAIQMKLGLAQRRLGADPSKVARLMVELRGDLDAAIQNMRALASSAYPPVLSDHGLARALARVRDDCPDAVILRVGELPRYPPGVEAAVYFTCMEALQNVAKHAHSDAPPAVDVREDGGSLRFEVADHGAGFEVQDAGLGSGILNMRERIEAVGGALSVVSAPGHGTVISGSVPVVPRRREKSEQAAIVGGGSAHSRG